MNQEDIDTFFESSTKNKNDYTNKLRESIIEEILNDKIPKEWFLSNPSDSEGQSNINKWYTLATGLKDYIKLLELEHGKLIKVERKAGRNFNYDFLFIFENGNIQIEFKYGVKTITEYPEILSISSDNFVLNSNNTYAEYFYDNYLERIVNGITGVSRIKIPEKDFYLKNIYKSSVNDPFFVKLKEINNFKETVDDSIDKYLENVLKFDFESFQKKIKEQRDKKFMLWKNNKFHMDSISNEELDIIHESHFKKGRNRLNNTVVIKNVSNTTEYHLLLRWKNHIGVLFPAWQIKFIRI